MYANFDITFTIMAFVTKVTNV